MGQEPKYSFLIGRLVGNLGRAPLILLLMCTPAAQLSTLLWLFCRSRFQDYVPSVGDWIYYWHEAATFCATGAGGGIYGNEESGSWVSSLLGNGASFTHSIWFPMLQGMFGRVVGWESYSPVLWNILLVSLSLLFFGVMVWRQVDTILLAITFFLTIPSLAVNLGIANQDATHIAIGITLAGLFVRYFRASSSNVRRRYGIAIFIATWLAGLIRLDWFVVLLPVLFRPGSWLTRPRQWAVRIGFLLIYMLTSNAAYMLFTAPYPYELYPGAAAVGNAPYFSLLHGDISPLLDLVSGNIAYILTWKHLVAGQVLFSSIVFLIVVTVTCNPWAVQSKTAKERYTAQCIFLTTISNVFIVLLMVVFYYLGMGSNRLLVPHFILCVLVVAAMQKQRIVYLMLALNVAFLPFTLEGMGDALSADYGYNRLVTTTLLREEGPLVRRYLHFVPGANPWCNTLLISSCVSGPLVQAVPPGIAFQYIRVEPGNPDRPYPYNKRAVEKPFLSRYILVKNLDVARFINQHNDIVPLVTLSAGTIYLNKSSPYCSALEN